MENLDKLKEHIKNLTKALMEEMNVTGDGEVTHKKDELCEDDQLTDTDTILTGIGEVTGTPKKGGRRFIPPTTILPGILVRPEFGFKIMSNGTDVNLFISPLGMAALEALQRGRSTMQQDEKLSQLTRIYRDKIPSMTRVIIKKGLKGIRINNQPWVPVGVEIEGVEENRDIIIKVPKGGEEAEKLQNPLYEQIDSFINEKLLLEGNYNQFRNEIKFRTKSEQLHKAIREVKRKLGEIDRIVEYTSRMKQELSEGEEGLKYWKATENAVGKIQETITQLSNKIRNLNQ